MIMPDSLGKYLFVNADFGGMNLFITTVLY